MTKQDIWTLFKETGNIKYYILYKNMDERMFDISANIKYKGTSN